MDVLAEKYQKTTAEKCLDVVNRILNFSVDTNSEEIWDNFEELINSAERENFKKHSSIV